MQTTTPAPTRPTVAAIALHGLTKTFRVPRKRDSTAKREVRAVRGIDLDVPAGQTVALLGPNGAGKSTTIEMLMGLLPADSGTIDLFGLTAARAVAEGRLGAMLQVGGVARYLSVRELLAMIADLYPAPMPVDDVIALTGITDLADRRTDRLSGGQTQRLRFALAVVGDPDLLVLDEPTVAMDVEARREFWATMREFTRSGKTVLFATHYLEEADAYADRIVLMAHGRIVADGPATEIKARVGMRTIRATLPGVDLVALAALPGVTNADTRGDAVVLNCADSDVALRALLATQPAARDIEVTGAGLEEAFVELTGTEDEG